MESKDEKEEPKDEDDEDTKVKTDPDDDAESDGQEESREEADIRDIRYKLEILIWQLANSIFIFPSKGIIPTNPWNIFLPWRILKGAKQSLPPIQCFQQQQIRKDLSAKERNLSVRNITFVFSKAF